MSLDDFVQNFLDDPNSDQTVKDDIRSLMTSHLVAGMELQKQGLLYEAVEEFAKENNRPINSNIDKEIVQKSYWHIGMVYQKLGKMKDAEEAFQRARELLEQYRVGVAPHYNLAEIFIEQGRFDAAIEVCQEALEEGPDGGIKQLLEKALVKKEGKSE